MSSASSNLIPARRLIAVLRWPFTSSRSAPLWLVVRLYLASVWFLFGRDKVLNGWLTENPMGELLAMIADVESSSAPFAVYRTFSDWMLANGIDRVLSIGFPLLELAIAAAFLSGIRVLPAAALAIFLNLNLILSGIANWKFDLRIIALQVALLLAWRVAGSLNLERMTAALKTALFPVRRAPREMPIPARRAAYEHSFSTESRLFAIETSRK